jgi:hypothetical protein
LAARPHGLEGIHVIDETYFAGISYEAPCPECGHLMLESFDRMPRREDGIIIVECPVHGVFHFRPVSDTKLVPGEPPDE